MAKCPVLSYCSVATTHTWYPIRQENILCSIILLTGHLTNFLRLPNVLCSIILLSGHVTSSLCGLLNCVLSYCSLAPPGFHTVYRRLGRRRASSQGSSCTPPAGPRWRSTWHFHYYNYSYDTVCDWMQKWRTQRHTKVVDCFANTFVKTLIIE